MTTPYDEQTECRFTPADLSDLVDDILAAEQMALIGPARHKWVMAKQIERRLQSPPPIWIWILMTMLDSIIPQLIAELKKRFGSNWPTSAAAAIATGGLTWLRASSAP